MPVRERYALVGHVVGVLDCVASLAGSPVATFRLHDRSIVIKRVEHYVLVCCNEVLHFLKSYLVVDCIPRMSRHCSCDDALFSFFSSDLSAA